MLQFLMIIMENIFILQEQPRGTKSGPVLFFTGFSSDCYSADYPGPKT